MYYDGDLVYKRTIGFSGEGGTGARARLHRGRATFTILEQWIEADEDGNESSTKVPGRDADTLPGDTLATLLAFDPATDLNGNEVTGMPW